jgi:hypothetical protein
MLGLSFRWGFQQRLRLWLARWYPLFLCCICAAPAVPLKRPKLERVSVLCSRCHSKPISSHQRGHRYKYDCTMGTACMLSIGLAYTAVNYTCCTCPGAQLASPWCSMMRYHAEAAKKPGVSARVLCCAQRVAIANVGLTTRPTKLTQTADAGVRIGSVRLAIVSQ